MTKFVIINTKNGTYWSNVDGWVDLYSATHYAEDERSAMNLPIGGAWLSLWEVDGLQFARLIAETEVAGAFTADAIDDMADAMDLESGEICELIERAQAVWDKIKERT